MPLSVHEELGGSQLMWSPGSLPGSQPGSLKCHIPAASQKFLAPLDSDSPLHSKPEPTPNQNPNHELGFRI